MATGESASVDIPLEHTQAQQSADATSPPVMDVSKDSPTASETFPTSLRPTAASGPHVPGLSEMVNEWHISHIPEEKQFYSTEGNLLEAAVTAIKARLDENDNVRQAWLLTEIDHWDLEKERVVVLTDSQLISVRYNFIQQHVEEFKSIPLSVITEIIVGEFKYTHSYAHVRKGKGMKILWGTEPLSFTAKWNPLSSNVPFCIFTSHVLVLRNKMVDPNRTIDTAIEPIVQAVRDFKARSSDSSSSTPQFDITEGDIVFDYYLGVSALIHNQSYLGFFKKRGAINW